MSRRALLSPDDARDAILVAAEKLFREIGYAKTTMADIAAACAVSPANLYRFFASKAAINDQIARRMLAGVRTGMRLVAQADTPPPRRLIDLILQMHRQHRDLFTDQRRVHDMVEAAMVENWAAIQEHIHECDEIAAGVIRDGIASGDFAPGDPAALASTAIQACCSICNPMMIGLWLDQSAADFDETGARRIAWLVATALANPRPEMLP